MEGEQRISPPGDNFTHRRQNSPLGTNSPLGSKFTHRVEVKNGPLVCTNSKKGSVFFKDWNFPNCPFFPKRIRFCCLCKPDTDTFIVNFKTRASTLVSAGVIGLKVGPEVRRDMGLTLEARYGRKQVLNGLNASVSDVSFRTKLKKGLAMNS
jgi:hypothetical protein